MRIRIACLDGEQLWIIDDVIGGLYSVDPRTFETKCVISYQKLFSYGKIEVQSLIKWEEEYIIIIPREIDRKWILYNKRTGEIKYRKVIERKCQGILISTVQDRNQLYFFPLYVYDPILIVDLETLTCSQMIENWSNGVPNDCGQTAWKGIYNGQYIFFSIENTKTLVRMDCKTQKVKLLELDIPERIIDTDYVFGELWVLPMKGNKLYQIDENGWIVNTAELLIENSTDSLPDFARIVAQKRYLFLLPYYQKGIYVYNKQNGKTYIIPKENLVLEEKDTNVPLRYWEYFVKDNQICFLPFRDSYIEIDLDNLVYKKRELFYPTMWSKEEKIMHCIWSHASIEDFILREMDVCNLDTFLKYIQYTVNKKYFLKNGCVSKMIWDMITA